MKFSLNFKSGLLKAMTALMAVCPAAVSCYDDSALQEQIDMLVDKLYELETRLSNEIDALQDMLRGKALITDVSTNAATGVTTITLSTGSTLQLLPEQDLESFVTYITLGEGEKGRRHYPPGSREPCRSLDQGSLHLCPHECDGHTVALAGREALLGVVAREVRRQTFLSHLDR